MPKRYTNTAKWDDDWFVSLAPEYKLLWFYLCDRCDHAGIWQVSASIPSRLIGGPSVDLKAAREAFGDRVDDSKPGYWRLTKFLEFQYGLPLAPTNKVHASAVKILVAHGYEASPYLDPSKPLPRPIQGSKDKDKDISSEGLDLKEAFNRFWDFYPKKVAKAHALSMWQKHKPPLELCLGTLAWQRRSEDWTKDGGKYIPHPGSWLNDGRWNDEDPNEHKSNFKRMAPRQKPDDDFDLPF